MFSYIYQPNIDPVILQIWGPLAIRWYSLMYIVGFTFEYLFLYFLIKKNKIKITEELLSDIIFVGILGILIGARLGYVLFYNLSYYLKNPLEIFMVWHGGMSFHGGMIFTIIFMLIFCWKRKINFIDLSDIVLVPLPMAYAFGRWGNFVNGELWGKPTDLPWGVIFRTVPPQKWFSTSLDWVRDMCNRIGLQIMPGQTLINLPRHPTQLYHGLFEGVLLFIVLYIIYKQKNKPRGIMLPVFLTGVGLVRFFIEFIREPDAHIGYLYGNWLTMGMVLSFPVILVGIIGIIYSLLKNEKNTLWVS